MKTFIFDLDGTLINSIPDIREAANHAFLKNGLTAKSHEQVREHVGHGLDDFLININLPTVMTPQQFAAVKADYWEYYSQNNTVLTTVYDGIPELLDGLKKRGCRVIMATNKSEEFAKAIAEKMFPGVFDFIIGNTDGVPPKPSPELGEYIMNLYNLTPEECVMVGDSKFDILFARNCGFYGVGVNWGFAAPGELELAKSDMIVDYASDILSLA